MAKINIDGKEYEMRFTLGFWEDIKKLCDVTQTNIQEKLNDDFGKIATDIVKLGTYYGVPREQRKAIEEMSPSRDEIKDNLNQSVIDAIEEAFIEGLSKAQKKLVEKAKQIQDENIERMGKKKE